MGRTVVNMSSGSAFDFDDAGNLVKAHGFPTSPKSSVSLSNKNNNNDNDFYSGLFGALKSNALLSSGISGGLGLANNLFNFLTGASLQKEQWKREDTAHQREVADLKAAGLSPVLSAGGSGLGSSSSVMQSYKPNLTEVPMQALSMYSNTLAIQRQAIENLLLSKDLDYKDSEMIRGWIGTLLSPFKFGFNTSNNTNLSTLNSTSHNYNTSEVYTYKGR